VALVRVIRRLLGLSNKMESWRSRAPAWRGSRGLPHRSVPVWLRMQAKPGYWGPRGVAARKPRFTRPSLSLHDPRRIQVLRHGSERYTAAIRQLAPTRDGRFDVGAGANDLRLVLPAHFATLTGSTTGFPVTCTVKVPMGRKRRAANCRSKPWRSRPLLHPVRGSMKTAPTAGFTLVEMMIAVVIGLFLVVRTADLG